MDKTDAKFPVNWKIKPTQSNREMLTKWRTAGNFIITDRSWIVSHLYGARGVFVQEPSNVLDDFTDAEVINEWFTSTVKGASYNMYYESYFHYPNYVTFQGGKAGRYMCSTIRPGYTEITFEQFKNFISLKTDEKMTTKVKGYNLVKEEYRKASEKIMGCNFTTSTSTLVTVESCIDSLKNAGVLDLWFKPVSESYKVGDVVKLSNNAYGWGSGREINDQIVQISKIRLTLHENRGGTIYFPFGGGQGTTVVDEIVRLATNEEIKEWKLEEAKRRYPAGSRIKSPRTKKLYTVAAHDCLFVNACGDVDNGGYGYLYQADTDAWAEIVNVPEVIVNGYTAEFFETYVKFGCATFSSKTFIDLAAIGTNDNDNRSVTNVTLGVGVFRKEDITKIADYYKSLKS